MNCGVLEEFFFLHFEKKSRRKRSGRKVRREAL